MQRAMWLGMVLMLVIGAGCANGDSQEFGQCEAPDEHLKVMFKPKTPGLVLSHSFCVVCNTAIEPEEFGAWAEAMGATSIPEEPELPCLHVYPGTPKNIESMSECHSLVCDGEATYSDMVSGSNGNIDLAPVLDGSAFEVRSRTRSRAQTAAPQGDMPPLARPAGNGPVTQD